MAGEISPIKIAVVLDTAKLENQLRGAEGKIGRSGLGRGTGAGGSGGGGGGGSAGGLASWLGLGGVLWGANKRQAGVNKQDALGKLSKERDALLAIPAAARTKAQTDQLDQTLADLIAGRKVDTANTEKYSTWADKYGRGKFNKLVGMMGKPGRALAKLGGLFSGGGLAIGMAGAAIATVGTVGNYNSNVSSGLRGVTSSFNPQSSIGKSAIAMQKAYGATTPKEPAGFWAGFGASVGGAGQGSLDAMSAGLGLFGNGALYGSIARAIPELALGGLGLLAGMDGPTMVPEQVGAKQVGQILKDTFDQWYVRNLGNDSERRQMKRQMQRQANIAERNAI
jgi:hypothetical protein